MAATTKSKKQQVSEVVDDAGRVDFFEAEDPDLIKGKDQQDSGRKKRRMVKVNAITMKAELPEQGNPPPLSPPCPPLSLCCIPFSPFFLSFFIFSILFSGCFFFLCFVR